MRASSISDAIASSRSSGVRAVFSSSMLVLFRCPGTFTRRTSSDRHIPLHPAIAGIESPSLHACRHNSTETNARAQSPARPPAQMHSKRRIYNSVCESGTTVAQLGIRDLTLNVRQSIVIRAPSVSSSIASMRDEYVRTRGLWGGWHECLVH
jgi:hypothetical protein